MKDIVSIAAAIIVAVGGAGAVIIALSAWLGKVWATRIAEQERAQHATELEKYRSELSELTAHRQDAVIRRRDIYADLAASMRVLLGKQRVASDDQIREFLRAYDVSFLWASEDVAIAIGSLLDAIVTNVAKAGFVDQVRLQALYIDCLTAMRKDSGFVDTAVKYRVVSF